MRKWNIFLLVQSSKFQKRFFLFRLRTHAIKFKMFDSKKGDGVELHSSLVLMRPRVQGWATYGRITDHESG